MVRRIVGYRRFEGLEAAAGQARLYATVRLVVNFFQPSFKLAEKARDGANVKKLADPRIDAQTKDQARAIHTALGLVALLRKMCAAQQHLGEIANKSVADDSKPTALTLEQRTTSDRQRA